jgi:hypothetical protein
VCKRLPLLPRLPSKFSPLRRSADGED